MLYKLSLSGQVPAPCSLENEGQVYLFFINFINDVHCPVLWKRKKTELILKHCFEFDNTMQQKFFLCQDWDVSWVTLGC